MFLKDESSSDEDDTSDDDSEIPEQWEGLSEDEYERLIEENVQDFGEEIRQPTDMQHSKILITWLLYFIFVWQFFNMVSDRSIESLLKYFNTLILVIGERIRQTTGSEFLISLASLIPLTMYSLRNCLGIEKDNFEKFVVCGKCTKLFKPHECIANENGVQRAKVCNNVLFPRSPRRKACGGPLMKKVILSNGKVKFNPIYTYCYRSIIDALESFLKRPGFKELCEEWRNRRVSGDTYADVMDGNVWETFLNYKGRDFLNLANTYGLMLNCDWFQPFKRRTDCSIGVLYLAVMNLPRSQRFKRENIILLGIIPGLKKEPLSLTHFLTPAVDELLSLWKGVKVDAYNEPEPVTIRAALLCCASDIPAARKLCGFLGHQANRGCSHCYKFFPGGFGEKRDYSGFEDRDSWPLRTDAQHRRDAIKTTKCKTKTKRKKMESSLGSRYTELLRLPYYGSVTMCIIDPMHNLFLGTAKKLFKIWIDKELLSKKDLNAIESRIEVMNATSDLGRLPSKIATSCGGFTASQWQNWILYYAMYCTEGILPEEHLNCLQTFVIACRLLCKTSISKTDLFLADRKLLDFAIKFERLYGKEAVTPNIHLHMHLKSCIENYGSVFGFWCFSFERYNGLLGNFHTNNRMIEVQLMRKFLSMSYASDLQHRLPQEHRERFLPIFKNMLGDTVINSQQKEINLGTLINFQSLTRGPLGNLVEYWQDLNDIILPNNFKLSSLDNDDLELLKRMYCKLYAQCTIEMKHLNRTFRKYSTVVVYNERFGSKFKSRLSLYGYIMASWADSNGNIRVETINGRPGIVKFFLYHTVTINGTPVPHVLAVVTWYKEKNTNGGISFRNPLSTWSAKEFVPPGPATFIPVQRFMSRFIHGNYSTKNEDFIVVSPLIRHMFQ